MHTKITETVYSVLDDRGLRGNRDATAAADAVIEALCSLADGLAEALVEKGRGLGATEAQVHNALVEVGLIEPEPEPVPEPASEQATEVGTDRLNRIEETLARLVRAAESRGLRI